MKCPNKSDLELVLFTDFDGMLFAFVDGSYVMRITEQGFLDRIRTRNLFRRAPWNMDAAYNIPSLGRTYFMKGIYIVLLIY